MSRRIARFAPLILAVTGALAFAAPASAATTPRCTSATLAPTGSLQDPGGPVTLAGSGTCTGGSSTTESAGLTLSGNAVISNCFSNPYIAISGTLTTTLADGTTYHSAATLNLLPEAGVSTGLARLTTAAGQDGIFTVGYSDVPDDSDIGLISRCGGGEFTFSASGVIV